MIKILVKPKGWIEIGRLGENEHRMFCFPETKEIVKMYPNAVITLLHKRPSDPDAYPVSPEYVTVEDGMVCWLVQSSDLAEEGRGQCEIIFVQNNVVAKDIIRETQILPALDGSGTPPDPWESWQTDITRIAGEIAQDRSAAEQAAEDATEAQRDAEAAQEAAESAARDAVGSAEDAASSARAAGQSVIDAGLAQDGAEEAQRKAETAQGKAEDAQSGAEEAQGKAETAKREAEEAAGAAATSERNAAGSVTDAAAQVELAKKYVDGKGTDGTVDPAFNENNAKYYAQLTQEAETTAVQAINTAGTNQVNAVHNKGTQVLNSIPADYTSLSGDVSDLKSALNEQLAMLIEKQEQPQPEPQTITQVCDLSGATKRADSSGKYCWQGVKIYLNYFGSYFANPYNVDDLCLSNGKVYDKNDNLLTVYRNGTVFNNGITTVGNPKLEFVDKRTIKEYRPNGTLVNTWTADGDISYINGNARIGYFSDIVDKAGFTYGGQSQTYIEYGDSSQDESEIEYEYAIKDYVGIFSHNYAVEHLSDAEPTDNSTNIVTSGGIKAALNKQFEKSCNLIDESKFDFDNQSTWRLEEGYYFPVTAGKEICTSVAKPRFIFYDANKAEISTTDNAPVLPYTLVHIPSNASFARISINATANVLSDIQGKIMVYEVDSSVETNDDRRPYVPPKKIIGKLVEGDIYETALPESLDIDLLNASQYKSVRALNHQRNAFRIATFNIYVTRQRSHWDVIKQELKDHAIDICAMQEVSNVLDSRYIQTHLTMNTWQFKYGSLPVINDTLADKAVVSMFEIISTELFYTTTGRPYIKTVINLPQYKRNAHQFKLSVYSAHLGLTASNRLVEAGDIVSVVANDTSDFIVICMDSNAFKTEMDEQGKLPTWETFISAGFTPIHYGEYSTITDMADSSQSLDQIFMGRNVSCIDYDIVNSNDYLVTISGSEVPVSDHCMVYADLCFDFDAVLSEINTND